MKEHHLKMDDDKSSENLSTDCKFQKLFSYKDEADDKINPLIKDVIISVIHDTLDPLSVISTLNQKMDNEESYVHLEYKTIDEKLYGEDMMSFIFYCLNFF